MHARAIEEAGARLQLLLYEERECLGVGALALGLAVAATEIHPQLALPLFLGGLAVGARGVRALWRRWDLLERLAGERDSHEIPEVLAFASREATIARRHVRAAALRRTLREPGPLVEARVRAVADELAALVAELEDPALELDPACAVACSRLVTDVATSPLLNPALAPEELRSRIRQIRSGFRRARSRPWQLPGHDR